MLASLLFGTYRQRVLGLLLLNPERSYFVREIARLTNTAAGTLHKELARLAVLGQHIGFDRQLRPGGKNADPKQTPNIVVVS